jgi:ATP-binding cassette subfamily F protein 2
MPPRARPPKKGSAKAKAAKEAAAAANDEAVEGADSSSIFNVSAMAAAVREAAEEASGRTSTGLLTSEKRARDIKIESFSLSLHSTPLVEDATIELNYGQRYGLIGRNGCGKSTLLRCLANREVGVSQHLL